MNRVEEEYGRAEGKSLLSGTKKNVQDLRIKSLDQLLAQMRDSFAKSDESYKAYTQKLRDTALELSLIHI